MRHLLYSAFVFLLLGLTARAQVTATASNAAAGKIRTQVAAVEKQVDDHFRAIELELKRLDQLTEDASAKLDEETGRVPGMGVVNTRVANIERKLDMLYRDLNRPGNKVQNLQPYR
jgi:hypothetical protein